MMKVSVRLVMVLLPIALTAPAFAEPVRVASEKPDPTLKRARDVVLAAADSVPPPPEGHLPPLPMKRIAPRVTTCRCGDSVPDSPTPNP
jgi:hypothetical protein